MSMKSAPSTKVSPLQRHGPLSSKFCELAMAYFPDSTSRRAASVRLSRWIRADTALRHALQNEGWKSGSHSLTPRQLRAFVRIMGMPLY